MAFLVHIVAMLCIVTSATNAAVASGSAIIHPDYPDKCWNAVESVPMDVGQSWKQPGCVSATCLSYGGRIFVQYSTCGTFHDQPGCKVMQNTSLVYPLCCPRFLCPKIDYSNLSHPEYEEFLSWLLENYDYSD